MNKKQTITDFSWQKLAQKPIIGLSPMDGVTDSPYRLIQKKYGGPDVVFSEFVNVEGLCHKGVKLMHHFVYNYQAPSINDKIKNEKLKVKNEYLEILNPPQASLGRIIGGDERPVIAQIYGKTPECFYQAALLTAHMGFDGIDINMGCPAKNVANNGAGAGLIRTPELAKEIIFAVKKARDDYLNGATLENAPDIIEPIKLMAKKIALVASGFSLDEIKDKQKTDVLYQELDKKWRRRSLPVSVKTRIGYEKPVTKKWIGTLLTTGIDVLSLHGRTLRQAYTGRANWNEIAQAAELARNAGVVFLGNGDVDSVETAYKKIETYGVDGALIGRASFGNPYVFKPKDFKPKVSLFKIAVEHAYLYEDFTKVVHTLFDQVMPEARLRLMGEDRLFLPFRKHLGWYVKGVPNAKTLRAKLVQTNSAQEVERCLIND